jgi:hypothetical protein
MLHQAATGSPFTKTYQSAFCLKIVPFHFGQIAFLERRVASIGKVVFFIMQAVIYYKCVRTFKEIFYFHIELISQLKPLESHSPSSTGEFNRKRHNYDFSNDMSNLVHKLQKDTFIKYNQTP